MKDTWGRTIDYMRISITDRCNLRCRYCMPAEIQPAAAEDILSYEEIVTFCEAAASLGISNIKVTGGEPLVREGCPALISRLKKIKGIRTVTLTTNGVLLGTFADEIANSGVDAVNISLDTLDRDIYQRITGRDVLLQVKDSIRRMLDTETEVKINCVLQAGMNDESFYEIIELAREHPLAVRFIEMMPIGTGGDYGAVSNTELLKQLLMRYKEMEPDSTFRGNGPAIYYRIPGFQGSIGFISAVHGKFCSSCNRIRLTAVGQLKPCLCYENSIDIREILRRTNAGESNALKEAIREGILQKPKQHCFEEKAVITEKRSMVKIGG